MAGDAILRPAGPDDPPMDAATAQRHFAAILAQPGMTIYVAVKHDIPLASCTLVVVPNLTRAGAPCALIENVVTAEAARRTGLGRAILKHAVDAAWQAGCYKVMLLTGRSDTGAADFYTSCGFKQNKTGFQVRRP